MTAVSRRDFLKTTAGGHYSFKLGKGRVSKISESEFKDTMSFAPRNIA